MDDDVISRVEDWLGSRKETREHPTVTLYTDRTARVIAVADLCKMLKLARKGLDRLSPNLEGEK